MKNKYLGIISLVVLFASSCLFAENQYIANSAKQTISGRVVLPEGKLVDFEKVSVSVISSTGKPMKAEKSPNPDGTFIVENVEEAKFIFVRLPRELHKRRAQIAFMAAIDQPQNEYIVSTKTTALAYFKNEVTTIYSTLLENSHKQADQVILETIESYLPKLEQEIFTNPRFTKQQGFMLEVDKVNSALEKAIANDILKQDSEKLKLAAADTPEQLLADLVTCKLNQTTMRDQPARAQRVTDFLKRDIERKNGNELYSLKQETPLFGGKITHIFPGSISVQPGFAVIIDTDVNTVRTFMESENIELGECNQKGCQNKINNEAEFILTDSEMFLGKSDNNKPSTFVACMYPYMP